MTKKKKPVVEAFDNRGPQNMAEGYTWCPECQASYEGPTCPGCGDPFAAGQPRQGITKETIDAIVDEAAAKGVDLDNFFPEGILDLTELTEEFGVSLLKKLQEGPEPGAETVEVFVEGDRVQLNSGGPEMIVKGEMAGAEGKLFCEWLSGEETLGDHFDPATIHKIVPPTTLAEVAEQASIETTTITEILPVPITDAEYKEIGLKMGAANQEIIQAENELKSVKSQYKSRIDSAKTRRDEYASIINAGHQQRQTECHLVKNFIENTITLIRLDTGEVVRTRTMTAAEKQRSMDFEE